MKVEQKPIVSKSRVDNFLFDEFNMIELNRRDILLSITGFILTAVIFFNHHIFSQYIVMNILGGLTGLLISKNIEYVKSRDYKYITVFTLGILILPLLILFLGGSFGYQCMMAVTGTAYDPINQECVTETFTCNVEFPWYYTDCPEPPEELCEDPGYFEENQQGCSVHGITPEELR